MPPARAAVDVFTLGFAKEVAAEAVRVNAVRPGVTDTDMIEPIRHGERRAAIAATIPIERYADPAEVGPAIALAAIAAGLLCHRRPA